MHKSFEFAFVLTVIIIVVAWGREEVEEGERGGVSEVLLHTFVRLPGSTTTSVAQPTLSIMSSSVDKVESS